MMKINDENSIAVLRIIAQERLGVVRGEIPPNQDLRSVLTAAFASSDQARATEGELARAALDLLRQDPVLAEPIQLATIQVGEPPSRDRYVEPLTTIPLVTAALALGDHAIERAQGAVCARQPGRSTLR